QLQGHGLILQLDIFNFLNLLNKDWGSRDFGSTNSPGLLTRRSYVAGSCGVSAACGAASAQPVFIYNQVNQFTTQNVQSNYQMQLEVKDTLWLTGVRHDGRRKREGAPDSAPPFSVVQAPRLSFEPEAVHQVRSLGCVRDHPPRRVHPSRHPRQLGNVDARR